MVYLYSEVEMKKHRPLIMILILAAVLRVGLLCAAFYLPGGEMLTPDSDDYINLSQSLAASGRFGELDRPEIFRTPGYPVFLIVCGMMGADFDISLEAAWLIQILLDVVVVFLTYRLGVFLVDRRAGGFAAFFQAITPLVVASSCRILSDSLYVFFFHGGGAADGQAPAIWGLEYFAGLVGGARSGVLRSAGGAGDGSHLCIGSAA